MKIASFRKITDAAHLNIYEIAYADTRGRDRTWRIASRNDPPRAVSGAFARPDAVVIVPYHTDTERLVIIREFRVPLADYQYGFPAGLVDGDESVTEAARRELYEETGLTLTRVHRVSPPIYSSSGMTDESVCMVYADCTGTPSNKANTASEDISALLVTPEDAARLCADQTAKFDVKTWLVLSVFAETGRVFRRTATGSQSVLSGDGG
ncbi:MAG: NUDIX hydrolase [Desulfobacteraceae bacterium]|jgi:ADP-ribose pyrophosphatase|nr:MAG: NUDIX hydrolase [Desulfobacteraceae bacterium]